ncbi:MAG TPA: bifunctional oligoribonuclease/PAP phosphatase NrnA [Gemmatimonadaceae bacterium]|nr:bifunctional oligoribonuclease/PAP phosphatase NrnA [Gemmatimonadaceae bacterium]
MSDLLDVSPARRAAIDALAPHLLSARTVALSTHINADGDGCGSEAALALLLAQRGIAVRIVNPTPWPGMFDYLLPGLRNDTPRGAAALQGVDRLVVLDISDVRRLGALADAVRALSPAPLVIDHHQPGEEPPGPVRFADTSACATGELVFDLAVALGLEITPQVATALYTAILTDTGGFRFSNTSARALAIASRLITAGVSPEEMYRRIYASMPAGRLRLLREVLETLEVDESLGLASVAIPAGALERHGLSGDDLDGIAEYPRSIAGTRLALLFRDLGHGKVKVSFRSVGDVDANALAARFGGGGHLRAAGALVAGAPADVRARVLAAAREVLAAGAGPPRMP